MKKLAKMAALVAAAFVMATALAACGKTPGPLTERPPVDPTVVEPEPIPERDDIPVDGFKIGDYVFVSLPSDPQEGDIVGYDTTYDEEDYVYEPSGYHDVTVKKFSENGHVYLDLSGFKTGDLGKEAKAIEYLFGKFNFPTIDQTAEVGWGIDFYDWGWQLSLAQSIDETDAYAKVSIAKIDFWGQQGWRTQFVQNFAPYSEIAHTFSDRMGIDGTNVFWVYWNTVDGARDGKVSSGYALMSSRKNGITAQVTVKGGDFWGVANDLFAQIDAGE
jgi:hypothetical protein